MAVIEVRGPLLEGTEYKDSTLSGSSAVLRFLVRSDDIFDGPLTMARDPRIPRKFSAYRSGNDFNENLILNELSWRPLGRKKNGDRTDKVWELICNYSPRTFSSNDPGDDPDNPNPPSENDSFSFSSSWEVVKIPFAIDVAGKPVVNSAGESFSPPYESSRRIKINRLTRRENIDPQQKAAFFSYKINEYPIWGKPALTWLIEILVSLQPSSGQIWWSVDYNMRYREEGWDVPLLDQGFNELKPDDENKNQLVEILDAEGAPVTTPRWLDGNGLVIPDVEYPNVKTPFWLTFKEFERADFSLLYLPNWMV